MSVRNAILGLLAHRACHGYELHAAFEALVGGRDNWDVKPAQIYTTLIRLQESGLVVEESIEQDAGPEKRIYALTPAGRDELDIWFKESVPSEVHRDSFYLKLMLSLALEEVDSARIIQIQRAALYQELHRVTTQRQCLDARHDLARILLLDKAIMHLEADLRWLDMVEARFQEISRQPLPQPEVRLRGRPPKKDGDSAREETRC